MAKNTPTVAGFKRLMKKYMPDEVVTEEEAGDRSYGSGGNGLEIKLDTDGVPYYTTP